MGYKIAGEYMFNCPCTLICPCSVDGPPNTKDGKCYGAGLFHVTNGTSNGTDLSGTDVAMIFTIPGNTTGGNWKIGLVFDKGTSDDKMQALEDIFQGRAGGPFAEFVPLISEFIPSSRAALAYKSGKESSFSIGDADFGYSPILGADGNPTTVSNAMFGFAPVYEVGKGSGSLDMSGIKFDATYGERAQFEYAS